MIDKVTIDPDDFFPPDITPKKCRGCAHAYYVYGIEFNCDRENNGKRCRFKRKTKEKQEEKPKMKEEDQQKRHIEISVVSVKKHTVTFRISRQTHREETFTPNGSEFKSSCGIVLSSQGSPEFGAYIKTLFVRGWDSSEDDNKITVSLHHFADIMQAVTEYNEMDGEGFELNVGDTFYIIDEFGDVEEREYEGNTDGIFRRKFFGNFFRTREEAEAASERVRKALKGDD